MEITNVSKHQKAMQITALWISLCEYLQEMKGSPHPLTSLHLFSVQQLASAATSDLSIRCKMLSL